MTNEEFRWWLRGFFELDEKPLTMRMLQVVGNHLNLAREVSQGLDETNRFIENLLQAMRMAIENDQEATMSQLQHQLKQCLFSYIGA
jgi:hypothetical protein